MLALAHLALARQPRVKKYKRLSELNTFPQKAIAVHQVGAGTSQAMESPQEQPPNTCYKSETLHFLNTAWYQPMASPTSKSNAATKHFPPWKHGLMHTAQASPMASSQAMNIQSEARAVSNLWLLIIGSLLFSQGIVEMAYRATGSELAISWAFRRSCANRGSARLTGEENLSTSHALMTWWHEEHAKPNAAALQILCFSSLRRIAVAMASQSYSRELKLPGKNPLWGSPKTAFQFKQRFHPVSEKSGVLP